MRFILPLLLLAVLGCHNEEAAPAVAPTFSVEGPRMDKIPEHVRARLAEARIDVAALEQLINTRKHESERQVLRRLISSEQAVWGISADEGTPESFLIDRAFEKTEGYQRINKK